MHNNYPPGIDMDRVLGGPHDIVCDCDHPDCQGMDLKGSVWGHIRNCPCEKCVDNEE